MKIRKMGDRFGSHESKVFWFMCYSDIYCLPEPAITAINFYSLNVFLSTISNSFIIFSNKSDGSEKDVNREMVSTICWLNVDWKGWFFLWYLSLFHFSSIFQYVYKVRIIFRAFSWQAVYNQASPSLPSIHSTSKDQIFIQLI